MDTSSAGPEFALWPPWIGDRIGIVPLAFVQYEYLQGRIPWRYGERDPLPHVQHVPMYHGVREQLVKGQGEIELIHVRRDALLFQ